MRRAEPYSREKRVGNTFPSFLPSLEILKADMQDRRPPNCQTLVPFAHGERSCVTSLQLGTLCMLLKLRPLSPRQSILFLLWFGHAFIRNVYYTLPRSVIRPFYSCSRNHRLRHSADLSLGLQSRARLSVIENVAGFMSPRHFLWLYHYEFSLGERLFIEERRPLHFPFP